MRSGAPAVLEAMDRSIQWNEAANFPYADGNPCVGPDAGDTVVATGRYNAAHKKTGAEIRAQFAHIWWLCDGKAVRFQRYTDTAQVLKAMGGA